MKETVDFSGKVKATGLLAVAGGQHLVAGALEDRPQGAEVVREIVHDQNLHGARPLVSGLEIPRPVLAGKRGVA